MTAPGRQASNILKAWVCRDDEALRHEFEEGLHLGTSVRLRGLEEEQVELLKTVVTRLKDCSSGLRAEPPDPMVRLCIDLLMHLANQSGGGASWPSGAAQD
jgi:hypothetical protein